jgi:predicted TIM-barrel fold metal-dependent hydrolase
MKIWDVHCHFPMGLPFRRDDNPDPAARLETVAEALVAAGVVRACLLCPDRFGMTHEEAIRHAARYPELFVPVAHVDPDVTDRRRVWELYRMGYRGLKLTGVSRPYDAPEYFPMYAAAEALGMPILFHLGVMGGGIDYARTHPRRDPAAAQQLRMFATFAGRRPSRDVSATRMHPFHLDTLANNFPTLKLIGAHLGGTGNYDAAASVARWRANVFFDMSGGEVIERHGEERGYIARDIAVEKLVWGSDCRPEKIRDHVERFERMFERLGLTEDEADRMWYTNAAEIYGEVEPTFAAE